jgi:hypothetical protein
VSAPAPKTTAATSGTTTTLNPVAAKISATPQLNARITALLPPNMTLAAASAGFKNQGQFIAALHVSHNLGIPFADLQNDMTTKHMSLGESIHALSTTVNAKHEVKKAETEATADLKASKGHGDR